jgi:UPF0755 protein
LAVSNLGLDFDDDPDDRPPRATRRGGRRAERDSRGRSRGCVPMLVVLVVVLVAAWLGGSWGLGKVRSALGDSPDYPGPGSGVVTVQVRQGETAAAIGRELKAKDVVKSVEAFTDAAAADDRSRNIQVGYYQLKKQMKASDALAVLIDPENLVQARLTVPEGYRVKDVVKAIAAKTDITADQVRAALKDTKALGLPAAAHGVVEGYLFPATYAVVPGETAQQLLKQMVAKTVTVMQQLDVSAKSKALGLTPEQVMTVASILEYEGSRDQDYPKIARAIYNRLDKGMALQSDATVAYANNLDGTVWTTQAERDNPSPYNTYVHTGLPPSPIGSPGEKTIEAALNPADGPWLYWLVVNLRTGETRFNETYEGHLKDREVLRKYCETSDAC